MGIRGPDTCFRGQAAACAETGAFPPPWFSSKHTGRVGHKKPLGQVALEEHFTKGPPTQGTCRARGSPGGHFSCRPEAMSSIPGISPHHWLQFRTSRCVLRSHELCTRPEYHNGRHHQPEAEEEGVSLAHSTPGSTAEKGVSEDSKDNRTRLER